MLQSDPLAALQLEVDLDLAQLVAAVVAATAVEDSFDSFPSPSASSAYSLPTAIRVNIRILHSCTPCRWWWCWGWYRSVTWILTRDTSRRNSKNWIIQRYPIRSCHPWRIPQRKSWQCQSTSNITHTSWRAQQSLRCCTCRLNWGRRPKRNRRWCWMRLNRWSSLKYCTSKTFWSRTFTWGPNVIYFGWRIYMGWRHSCLKRFTLRFRNSEAPINSASYRSAGPSDDKGAAKGLKDGKRFRESENKLGLSSPAHSPVHLKRLLQNHFLTRSPENSVFQMMITVESSGSLKQDNDLSFGFWYLHSGYHYLNGSTTLRSLIYVDVGELTSHSCSMTGRIQDHYLLAPQYFESLGTSMSGICYDIAKQYWAAWGLFWKRSVSRSFLGVFLGCLGSVLVGLWFVVFFVCVVLKTPRFLLSPILQHVGIANQRQDVLMTLRASSAHGMSSKKKDWCVSHTLNPN